MKAQRSHRKFLKHGLILMALFMALGLFFMTDIQKSFAIPGDYTITAVSSNLNAGTVSGGGVYFQDAAVDLVATPKDGCRFVGWTNSVGTEVSQTATYSFYATENITLTANFEVIPTPVIATIVSSGYNSASLTWAEIPGAYTYEVSYATSATGPYTKADDVSSTSYTITGLNTNQKYYVRIMASLQYGTIISYSPYSASKTVTPIPSTPVAKAASASYTSIKVSWPAVPGATGYKVSRATSSTGSYTALPATANLYYTNTGLTTGKTYYYKVVAYKAVSGVNVNSKASAVVSAKPVPAAPTCSLATITSTSVKIGWTTVSGATSYQIYRSTSKEGTYAPVYTAASTLKSYVNTGLTTGATYYYKVRAYHLEGTTKVYGSYSEVKSVKVGEVYYSGLYKVGRDIPSGDYMVVSTKAGYSQFSITTDSAGNNEIGYGYADPNRYVRLVYGQYVDFDYSKIYPLANAPMAIKNEAGNLISGQYKVGRDIQPGTYVLIPNAGSEYSEFSIDKDALNFAGNEILDSSEIAYNSIAARCYVTVSDGQYLTIYEAVGYTLAEAPPVDISKNYLEDGQYLVGQDIQAGVYTLTGLTFPELGSAMGMFEIDSDATYQEDSIISMGYVFSKGFSVVLEDGQYITLMNTRMDFPSPI